MTQRELAAVYIDTLSAWSECAAQIDGLLVYYRTYDGLKDAYGAEN